MHIILEEPIVGVIQKVVSHVLYWNRSQQIYLLIIRKRLTLEDVFNIQK